jgi:hypothetical protein
VEEVIASCVIVVSTIVVLEIIPQRRTRQFFSKQIDFVEEKNLSKKK